ncbi:MAG: TraX family protein [Tissierellaceae bacterium]
MNVLVLKLIALSSMIVDHYGAIFRPGIDIYRIVGRLAFPIYAFLLVEGYFHTRDIKKYGLRLFAFALISEIPFDYAFYGGLSLVHQNIFFTLFLGLVAIYVLDNFKKKQRFLKFILLLLTAFIAEFLHTDYGLVGIMYIIAFYIGRKFSRAKGLLISGLILSYFNLHSRIQQFSILSLPILYFYNGELGPRSRFLQWFFYMAYPLHLSIFYIARLL